MSKDKSITLILEPITAKFLYKILEDARKRSMSPLQRVTLSMLMNKLKYN